MKSTLTLVVALGLVTFLVRCASYTSSRSIAQLRVMQNRVFDGVSAQDVIRNLKYFLQSEGHVIRSYDEKVGSLQVGLKRPTQPTLVLWRNWQFYLRDPSVAELSLSATVVSLAANKAELRVSLQKIDKSRLKGIHGIEVLDDSPYRALFNALTQRLQTGQVANQIE